MRMLLESLERLGIGAGLFMSWDKVNRTHAWEAGTVRVFVDQPRNLGLLPTGATTLYVVDLSGLGRVGTVDLPGANLEPVARPTRVKGRAPTKARWQQYEGERAQAERNATIVGAALEQFWKDVAAVRGRDSFDAAWHGIQAAAARAGKAVAAAGQRVVVEEGIPRDLSPKLERMRQPLGLDHEGVVLRGKDFEVSYQWPTGQTLVALRPDGSGRKLNLKEWGGKYARATIFAQWVERHAAQFPQWTLADVHDSLAAEDVPVTFELSYWDRP